MKKIISIVLALAMVLSLGVSVFAEGETKTLDDVLNAAQTVTLPMATEYELGSEEAIDFEGRTAYGFAVKVNLEAQNVIETKFYNKASNVDTVIKVYRKNGEAFEQISSKDSDNYYNSGERMTFVADKADEYYILFHGFDSGYVGVCTAEAKLVVKNGVGTPLNFNTENPPVPAEGDLWAWDAASKTLTIKDGFYYVGAAEDGAGITLPDGSTLIVEGKATLRSYGNGQDGIACEGALTIKGSGADKSVLDICADEEGVYADGALTVENIAANIEVGSDGFISYGDTFIRNAKLDFITSDEGIDVNWSEDYERESDLTIENSTVKLVSDEEAMQVGGNITIKNCNTDVFSTGEEGIDAGGNIEIIGGKLVVVAEENALETDEKITLTNVVFDIRTTSDSYRLIDMDNAENFSLPGTFRLYDFDGNQLYEGEWKSELLNWRDYLYVGDTQVFRAASVVEEPEPEPTPKPAPNDDSPVIKIGAAASEKGEQNPSTGAEVIG